jgi:hypothetical protein
MKNLSSFFASLKIVKFLNWETIINNLSVESNLTKSGTLHSIELKVVLRPVRFSARTAAVSHKFHRKVHLRQARYISSGIPHSTYAHALYVSGLLGFSAKDFGQRRLIQAW